MKDMTNVSKMEIFECALDWIYYPIWVHDINNIIAIFMASKPPSLYPHASTQFIIKITTHTPLCVTTFPLFRFYKS
jgi:hypothetical protein